jgi:hypothetical protein
VLLRDTVVNFSDTAVAFRDTGVKFSIKRDHWMVNTNRAAIQIARGVENPTTACQRSVLNALSAQSS